LPLGGYVIKYLGYHYLFAIAALIHLIPVILALRLIKVDENADEKTDGNTKEKVTEKNSTAKIIFHPLINLIIMLKEYKKLRTITVLEGALHFFPLAVINVYTLLFFHEETKYGLFLGYLGLIGIIASIAVSCYSDNKKERLRFLLIPFLCLSLTIFFLPLAKTQTIWIILVTIVSLLLTLTYPLRMAFSMDHKTLDYTFWRAREFFLNLGRFVTLALSSLLFYWKEYWLAFALFGLIVLIYPLVAKYKLRQLEKQIV